MTSSEPSEPRPQLYAVNLTTGEVTGGPTPPNVQHYNRETGSLTVHPLNPRECDTCVETAALMEALGYDVPC